MSYVNPDKPIDKHSKLEENLKDLYDKEGNPVTREWDVTPEDTFTTHKVVVKDSTNKRYLLSFTFKGTSEEERLTQVLAMKALKSEFKKFSEAEAKSYIQQIKNRVTWPKIYIIKDEKKAYKGTVIVWPSTQKDGKPHVWASTNLSSPTEKVKFELPADAATFQDELVAFFNQGIEEKREWSLNPFKKSTWKNLFHRSAYGQIGTVVDPKFSTWKGVRAKLKKQSPKAAEQEGYHAPKKGGPKISKLERAREIVKQLGPLFSTEVSLHRKEEEVSLHAPIKAKIIAPEENLVLEMEVEDNASSPLEMIPRVAGIASSYLTTPSGVIPVPPPPTASGAINSAPPPLMEPPPSNPRSTQPSWLHKTKEEVTDEGRLYTYTLNVSGKRQEPRMVTVQILENKKLTDEQLATRQLGHITLLKSMHQAGKEVASRAGSEDPFKVGRDVELVTDNKALEESQRAELHIHSAADEQLDTKALEIGGRRITLHLQDRSHKGPGTILQRCEAIRAAHFREQHHLSLEPKDPSEEDE